MAKICWLTDIHLNFLQNGGREKFYQSIAQLDCDIVLITGDIGEANSIGHYLTRFQEHLTLVNKGLYFVLGNHDYYGSSITLVRDHAIQHGYPWLGKEGKMVLLDGGKTSLIGVDGWADGRNGDYAESRLVMNDSVYIQDLKIADMCGGKWGLKAVMERLADQDAENLATKITQCLQSSHLERIIIATHIPPFEIVCTYDGKPTKDTVLPFYSSKVLGDLIYKFALENPAIEFAVLSGHTHSKESLQLCANLLVKVGGAEYNAPEIQGIINTVDVNM